MTERPPHITVIANSISGLGGAQRSTVELFEAAHRRGATISLVHGHEGDLAPKWRSFAEPLVQVGSTLLSRRHIRSFIRAVPAVRRHVRVVRADWVCTYTLSQVPLALSTGRPVALHVRDPAPRPTRRNQLAVRHISKMLFVSDAMRREWANEFPVAADGVVVPNGTPQAVLDRMVTDDSRAQIRSREGWPDDEELVGFVGRDVPVKRLDLLIEAMAIVRAHRRARLVVAGDLRESTRNLAHERLPAAFTDLGYVEDPWAVMSAMNLVVVPSDREPFGRVALEAVACGVPVVASAVDGLAEVLSGLPEALVEPSDEGALADKITEVLDDPQAPDRLQRIADTFSWDRSAELLLTTLSG